MYVAGRVGAVCLLACVIACGLCEVLGGGQLRQQVPGGGQLRLALVCGWYFQRGQGGQRRHVGDLV